MLELCGDAITNPDLRSFYFQSANMDDSEAWTKALLSGKHSLILSRSSCFEAVANLVAKIQNTHRSAQCIERRTRSLPPSLRVLPDAAPGMLRHD
eukprot:5972811-Ditylum_brightwellii.AAC.1